MATIALTDTVSVIAITRPDLLAMQDRLGIDYCCHGSYSISDACERAGIAPVRVPAETRAAALGASSGSPLTPTTMTEWCDHIERTHHTDARAVSEQMSTVASRVAEVHGARHPEFAELITVINTLCADMLDHLVREERVLFPWIRRLETPHVAHFDPPWSVRGTIDCMAHDYDEAAAALARLRTLMHGFMPPSDGCGSVVALFNAIRDLDQDTRRHVHTENTTLFPAAVAAEKAREGHAPERVTEGGVGTC